jgi:hypothetical protein
VAEQDDASWTDDEPRAGDVNRVGEAVERLGEPGHLGDKSGDVASFDVVDGRQSGNGGHDLLAQSVGSAVDAHGSAP